MNRNYFKRLRQNFELCCVCYRLRFKSARNYQGFLACCVWIENNLSLIVWSRRTCNRNKVYWMITARNMQSTSFCKSSIVFSENINSISCFKIPWNSGRRDINQVNEIRVVYNRKAWRCNKQISGALAVKVSCERILKFVKFAFPSVVCIDNSPFITPSGDNNRETK